MKKLKGVTSLTFILVTIAMLVTVVGLPSLYAQSRQMAEESEKAHIANQSTSLTIDSFFQIFDIYEQVKQKQDETTSFASLYIKDGKNLTDVQKDSFNTSIQANIDQHFSYTKNMNDFFYYAYDQDTKKTVSNTDILINEDKLNEEDLSMEYEWYIEIIFDDTGTPTITQVSNDDYLQTAASYYYDIFDQIFHGEGFKVENTLTNTTFLFDDTAQGTTYEYQGIKNTTFRFAVPLGYGEKVNAGIDDTYYPNEKMFSIFAAVALVMSCILVFIIQKHPQESPLGFHEKNNKSLTLRDIPFEFVLLMDAIIIHNSVSLGYLCYRIGLAILLFFFLYLFIAYSIWYFALLWKHKDFKNHSVCIWFWNLIKDPCHKLYEYALHLDMSNHDTKRLFILVFLNFLLLFIINGFFDSIYDRIIAYILYSIALYFFLRKYIRSVNTDYHQLLDVIRNIAVGKTNDHMDDDLGIFNPFKPELKDIQTNIETAINEEVHSQKMKTELITNVSHDLKTPLTSLISYIDLLKKDDVSEADRKKYLDILEKSSNRLKHLVEDLFEVSKANSGNSSLDLMKVDIVSLLKQVQVECDDVLKKRKLTIRNTFSDDKIILLLDSQKTYRIFENLISNISKYSLRGTRVYIDIKDYDSFVEVSMKNIAAQELNFDVNDITERFMRGDKSRNTEGSGLGLAIVKSFVELQNGTLQIQSDGDLFKVCIRFPKTDEPVKKENK